MALINAKTPKETAEVIARTGVAATQTDAARNKDWNDPTFTLVEKLNRFREELVKHMQNEIIFNPNHILAALRHNDKTWDEVGARRIADPNYKKRTVIFSQLVGWAQRIAAEPVKQDIRQGTYCLTAEKAPRSRPACFNAWDNATFKIVRNSVVDSSLINASSFDGVGYRFATPRNLIDQCDNDAGIWLFSKLMSSKNSKLSELVTYSRRACVRKRECVVS